MNTYDPRVLVRAFNILQEELQQFNQVSSDTLKESEHTQKCAQERFNQASRSSAIALNQAKSDIEDVKSVDQEIRILLSDSNAAIETAHQTVAMVDKSRQQAEITLEHWQNELQIALAWQARAEARLQRAIQEYERAQRSLASAKQDLAYAESSLRSCVKNPERKSCSGEERAYNNARAAVAVAIEELQEAEIELRAAQEELEMAKARVRCCRQAVAYAEKAMQHANLATEQANQALNEAERSLESATSADRAIAKASTKATEEHELVEQATGQIRQAESFVTQSQVSIQLARNKSDSAYNLAKQGSQELGYRTKQLIDLNRSSSSGFWGTVEKGVAVVQIVGGLFAGVVSTPVPDGRLFGMQSQDDIVLAAGESSSSVNRENIKRRDEELDISSQVSNTPTTSAPPNP